MSDEALDRAFPEGIERDGGSDLHDDVYKPILDAHADCCDRLARSLAAQPVLGPEAIQALDGYAALVGRENVPPDVWAGMSRDADGQR